MPDPALVHETTHGWRPWAAFLRRSAAGIGERSGKLVGGYDLDGGDCFWAAARGTIGR